MQRQQSFVIPVNEDQKKALLFAFYNTLLFSLVFFSEFKIRDRNNLVMVSSKLYLIKIINNGKERN